jgi:hypothetical protein
VLLICFVIVLEQLYEATHKNQEAYLKKKDTWIKPLPHSEMLKIGYNGKTNRRGLQPDYEAEGKVKPKKDGLRKFMTFKQKIVDFDYAKFVMKYLPFVCLWINRLLAIAFAYGYHGYPCFFVLTWLLLSFMADGVYKFINFTTLVYMPIFTFVLFSQFFFNIPLMFSKDSTNSIFASPSWLFSTVGCEFKIPPVEVGGMVINLIFLMLMHAAKDELKTIEKSEI